MTKQEALAEIEVKLNQMKQALKEAQELADKHGLSFKASLDLRDTNPLKGEDAEYGAHEIEGEYNGNLDESGNSDGTWYWCNSSLNC